MSKIRRGNQGGISLVQTLIAAGLAGTIILAIVQSISNTLKTQRQSKLQNTRLQLVNYYSDILRNPLARQNTFAAANNPLLADHVDVATASPPAGISLGTFNPELNINQMNLQDANNNTVIPGTGLYLDDQGAVCDPACDDTNGSWMLEAQWVAQAGTSVDTRVRIRRANLNSKLGDIRMKDASALSSAAFDDGDWTLNAGDVYRQTGNVGVGTNMPLEPLDVVGNVRVDGQIYTDGTFANGASTAINWDAGNVQTTTASCGAFTFTNMRDGGSYTLIVQGSVAGLCTFSQTGLNFRFQPANGDSTVDTHTVYTFLRAGTEVYISWIPGF